MQRTRCIRGDRDYQFCSVLRTDNFQDHARQSGAFGDHDGRTCGGGKWIGCGAEAGIAVGILSTPRRLAHIERCWTVRSWRQRRSRQRASRPPDKPRWLRHRRRRASCTQQFVGTRIGEAWRPGPAKVKTAKDVAGDHCPQAPEPSLQPDTSSQPRSPTELSLRRVATTVRVIMMVQVIANN